MEMPKPQSQHEWLDKLVGEWTSEMNCSPGPGQPPVTTAGTDHVRSLGGLWVVCEGRSTGPDGAPMTSLMTLGYDPTKPGYVGTFIASCMTYLWNYAGQLDETGRRLTLSVDGPSMADPNKLVPYEDIIEFVDDDTRLLRSRIKGDDGEWSEFMAATYRRKK